MKTYMATSDEMLKIVNSFLVENGLDLGQMTWYLLYGVSYNCRCSLMLTITMGYICHYITMSCNSELLEKLLSPNEALDFLEE